jgi:GNAT superfamily N-acetyltransferase
MSIEIVPVTLENVELVLPLIADYQRFYQATPDTERNRNHFGRVITTPALGAQWVALSNTGHAMGFVTAYRVLSSVSAVEKCLLNDLYVVPDMRGQGLGRKLIVHCTAWAVAKATPACIGKPHSTIRRRNACMIHCPPAGMRGTPIRCSVKILCRSIDFHCADEYALPA